MVCEPNRPPLQGSRVGKGEPNPRTREDPGASSPPLASCASGVRVQGAPAAAEEDEEAPSSLGIAGSGAESARRLGGLSRCDSGVRGGPGVRRRLGGRGCAGAALPEAPSLGAALPGKRPAARAGGRAAAARSPLQAVLLGPGSAGWGEAMGSLARGGPKRRTPRDCVGRLQRRAETSGRRQLPPARALSAVLNQASASTCRPGTRRLEADQPAVPAEGRVGAAAQPACVPWRLGLFPGSPARWTAPLLVAGSLAKVVRAAGPTFKEAFGGVTGVAWAGAGLGHCEPHSGTRTIGAEKNVAFLPWSPVPGVALRPGPSSPSAPHPPATAGGHAGRRAARRQGRGTAPIPQPPPPLDAQEGPNGRHLDAREPSLAGPSLGRAKRLPIRPRLALENLSFLVPCPALPKGPERLNCSGRRLPSGAGTPCLSRPVRARTPPVGGRRT